MPATDLFLRQFIKVNNLQETVFSFRDKYVIGENHHDYILLQYNYNVL